MRRFCKVPGEIFNNFLTSLLFSHFLDAPCPSSCTSFLISVKSLLSNSLKSSLVMISKFILPSVFWINIKPVRGNDHLDSLERNGSKVGGNRAKWMTNGSVWSDLEVKPYSWSLGTILKSLSSSAMLIYLAGLSSLLAGK